MFVLILLPVLVTLVIVPVLVPASVLVENVLAAGIVCGLQELFSVSRSCLVGFMQYH